jgi:hypothetical protein
LVMDPLRLGKAAARNAPFTVNDCTNISLSARFGAADIALISYSPGHSNRIGLKYLAETTSFAVVSSTDGGDTGLVPSIV